MPTGRLEDRIKAMIIERLALCASPDQLGDNDDLLSKWRVDLELMEIVIGLEEIFSIQFGDGELSVKKFRTVKNIAEVVRAKGVS